MENEIRRQDRKISDAEALEILHKGEYGVLSMCTLNNEGYGIPLNFTFYNNKIYFHCAIEGAKLNYLRNNNKVSFCVVGHTEVLPSKFATIYESIIVFGLIKEIDGDKKREALLKIVEKYSADFMQGGIDYINKLFDKVNILELSIDSYTGKARRQ